jgi:hypothetical protein
MYSTVLYGQPVANTKAKHDHRERENMCNNAPSVAAGCLQRRLCDRRRGDCPDLAKSAIYSTVVQHRPRRGTGWTNCRRYFVARSVYTRRSCRVATAWLMTVMILKSPKPSKLPNSPPAHLPFPLGPGDIGARRTCSPNRSSRSLWDAGMPWGAR